MFRLFLLGLAVGFPLSHARGDEPPKTKVTALKAGDTLKAGEDMRSPGGRYSLCMQTDGNLVWYDGPKALWCSNTSGDKDSWCAMQDDGNLVVYAARNGKSGPAWATDTAGIKGTFLACQDDGNVVLYAGSVVPGSYVPRWCKDVKLPGLEDFVKASDYLVPIAAPVRQMNRARENMAKLVRLEIVPDTRVSFDNEVIEKVVDREPLETIRGVKYGYTAKRSVETTVTKTLTAGVEVGGGVKAGTAVSLSLDVKGRIEASLGITMTKTYSVEQMVTVGENDVTKVTLVWIERFKKVRIKQGDSTEEVLVTVGLRLKIEEAK